VRVLGGVVVLAVDERDTVQKKTFTKWLNKHLVKVTPTPWLLHTCTYLYSDDDDVWRDLFCCRPLDNRIKCYPCTITLQLESRETFGSQMLSSSISPLFCYSGWLRIMPAIFMLMLVSLRCLHVFHDTHVYEPGRNWTDWPRTMIIQRNTLTKTQVVV